MYTKDWRTQSQNAAVQFGALGHVAQSVAVWLKSKRSWVQYQVRPHTLVSPSADSRMAVVSYWQKCVHEVLVNR